MPAAMFPMVFSATVADGREIWRERVDAAGALVIPPLRALAGEPVAIHIEYGDGTTEHQYPPDWDGWKQGR